MWEAIFVNCTKGKHELSPPQLYSVPAAQLSDITVPCSFQCSHPQHYYLYIYSKHIKRD